MIMAIGVGLQKKKGTVLSQTLMENLRVWFSSDGS